MASLKTAQCYAPADPALLLLDDLSRRTKWLCPIASQSCALPAFPSPPRYRYVMIRLQMCSLMVGG